MRMTIQRKMAEYRMRLNTLTALLPSGSNFNTLPAQSQSLPPVTPAEVKKQLNLRGPSAMDGSEYVLQIEILSKFQSLEHCK